MGMGVGMMGVGVMGGSGAMEEVGVVNGKVFGHERPLKEALTTIIGGQRRMRERRSTRRCMHIMATFSISGNVPFQGHSPFLLWKGDL